MQSFWEKIQEARKIAQNFQEEGPKRSWYEMAVRRLSIYVSYFCYRAGVKANTITVITSLFIFIGGLCYFPRNIYINIVGIVLLMLMYLLDAVDGEVARLRDECSVLGIYLDYITHHTASPMFTLAFGMHVYFLDKSYVTLALALALYSIYHWYRGAASSSRAALFKVGYRGSWQKDKTVKKKGFFGMRMIGHLARTLFSICAVVLTGLCIVSSYFIGTEILYIYLYAYVGLSALALMGMLWRDTSKLSKVEQIQ